MTQEYAREQRDDIPLDDCVVRIEVGQKTKVAVRAAMRGLLLRLRASGEPDFASMEDLALEELAADLAAKAIDDALEDAVADASDLDHFMSGESMADIMRACLELSVAAVKDEYTEAQDDGSPPSTASVQAAPTNVVPFRGRRKNSKTA